MKRAFSLLLALIMLFGVFFCAPSTRVYAKAKISSDKLTMYVGETCQLAITGTEKEVTWSSSNRKLATVDKTGLVTAKKAGKAVITGIVNGKEFTCEVTVSKPKLNKKKVTLETGNTFTLKPIGTTAVTFTSSNKKVASVDEAGKVKGLSAGTATISVECENKKTYQCSVTVTTPTPELTATPTPVPKSDKLKHVKDGRIYVDLTEYPNCGFGKASDKKTFEDIEEVLQYIPYIKVIDKKKIYDIAGNSIGKKKIYDMGTYVIDSTFRTSILEFNVFWLFCKAQKLSADLGITVYPDKSLQETKNLPYQIIYRGVYCKDGETVVYRFELIVK